jgi:hypothetical protein
MGGTRPYYRRTLPKSQIENDFSRQISIKQVVRRLRNHGKLPTTATVSVKGLVQQFKPHPKSSVRSLLVKLYAMAGFSPYVDLLHSHLDSYDVADPVTEANRLFVKRAAAAVYASVGPKRGVRVFPNVKWETITIGGLLGAKWPYHVDDDTGVVSDTPGKGLFSSIDLLEMKFYGDAAPTIFIPTVKCLSALAYKDFFPDSLFTDLNVMVSKAILAASPGWCGTFGPGVDAATDIIGDFPEGNYDMSEMHLLAIAYGYYEELSPQAREHLITVLLARGRIHRPRLDDTFTSGGVPGDWSRAGFVSPAGYHIRIGETENHILTILTARYLTNQLLYQRNHHESYDNRRNGYDLVLGIKVKTRPHCTELLLTLLRNILIDDFSEYNAKSYQTETRSALLNLCSFAYDSEVRLAARMVLDYISARICVSSNDTRRMAPFRRRNEGTNVSRTADGFMTVGLLEWQRGADPTAGNFAIQAGNTRAYEFPYEQLNGPDRPLAWSIADNGGDATLEALSEYRLPPSIHDLFVNDKHRRFFQRLHRFAMGDVEVTGRNCINDEIYAGSPSYLISAGGRPATYAIDPGPSILLPKGRKAAAQQLGVAVTTSFMPTSQSPSNNTPPGQNKSNDTQNDARDLIQFSSFSQKLNEAENYGVAPDFACGHQVHLPNWCLQAIVPQRRGKFDFVDKKGASNRPGFFLALLRDGDFTVMEAFDTWLHPELTFDQFRSDVWARNKKLSASGLHSNVEAQYTTQNGNKIHFTIWDNGERENTSYGARVLGIEFGSLDVTDGLGDASQATDQFQRGTVINSRGEGIIEINNPFLDKKIILDLSDPWHPRRTSESGEVEEAGSNREVWVDFTWNAIDAVTGSKIKSEGDFFRPFTTIAAAVAAVTDGGVIKIMPGSTRERSSLHVKKRFRIVAPIGDVSIGVL